MIDARPMAAAAALAERGRVRSWPNPNVGCMIVKDGVVVGRGWTQPGGRPHAEAVALAEAGPRAAGATLYVTLEPCAHASARGPCCAATIATAGIARVAFGLRDPDPRTDGEGAARLREAGVETIEGVGREAAAASLEGYLARRRLGRPHVTLKLAVSIDGCIARADGESRWITGEAARAHAHVERSRAGVIVVGRGTSEADEPRLDVRLAGLEHRSPQPMVLSSRGPLQAPRDVAKLESDHVLVEGGAEAASAFLREDLVDRLLIYTAPILVGGGRPALGDIGLVALADAHGRWRAADSRRLGSDRFDVYERLRD